MTFLSNVSRSTSSALEPYIRSALQPFAITGDTILVFQQGPDAAGVVAVERLTGDSRNVYYLEKTNFDVPAAPRLDVPSDQFQYDSRYQVFVPLEFQARRIYSTSSERYVFYSQSPNLEVFNAFFDYCREPDLLPKFQFILYSSYTPLRVYRVRAYCLQDCFDVAAQVTFQGFSTSLDCSLRFNASIQAVEYIDANNVAVIVQEADHTYDAQTDSGTGSLYKTYWLNPETMQLRSPGQGMWGSPTSTPCIDIIMPPRLGFLVYNLIAMPVLFARFVVSVLAYSPGVVQMWSVLGALCPVTSYDHSVLETCAQSVYSLSDYFDAVDNAGMVVWGVLLYLGNIMSNSVLSTLLSGLAYYGDASTDVNDLLSKGPQSILNTPFVTEMQGLVQILRTQDVSAGVKNVGLGLVAWGRFSYEGVVALVNDLLRGLITSRNLDAATVWLILSNNIYNLQTLFDNYIGVRMQGACTGLQMALGGQNPIGIFAYSACASNMELLRGIVRFFGVVLVEVPLVKCTCTDSIGYNPAIYVMNYCIPKAPNALVPVLADIVNSPVSNQACSLFVSDLKASLTSVFDQYFNDIDDALTALGDVLDYMLVAIDPKAGQCENFQNNPNIVVIVPEPVDYFSMCGNTSTCKSRCASEWQVFQDVANQYTYDQLLSTVSIQQSTESLFFPYNSPDSVLDGTIVAMTQIADCGNYCVSTTSQCLYVAVQVASSLYFRMYCVPSDPVQAVYKSSEVSISFDQPIVKALFVVDQTNATILAVMRDIYSIVIVSQTDTLVLVNLLEPYSEILRPLTSQSIIGQRIIDFAVFTDKIVLSLGVNNNGTFGQKACLFVDPIYNISQMCSLDDSTWRNYIMSQRRTGSTTSCEMLAWPTEYGKNVHLLSVNWQPNLQNLQLIKMDIVQPQGGVIAPNTVLASNIIFSKYYIEDTTNYVWIIYMHNQNNINDWLQQIRASYDASSYAVSQIETFRSQSVPATVQLLTGCDGLDCRGCPDLQLQALCRAYQTCSVFRCIGTPVNLNRPLCSIGMSVKSAGILYIQHFQATYIVFSQVFISLVQIVATEGSAQSFADLSFPDDQFTDLICNSKDLAADLVSIVTATINNVYQAMYTGNIILQTSSSVDSNVFLSVSLSMTALTGFLQQVLLAPVFFMIASHTIVMCNMQGVVAVINLGTQFAGIQMNLLPTRYSSQSLPIGGMCLTNFMTSASSQLDSTQAQGVFKGMAGYIITQMTQLIASFKYRQYAAMLHLLDAGLAYLSSVINKFGDLLAGLDLKNCLVPNVYIGELLQCACGDDSVLIPAATSYQGVQEKAHWCTGSLFISKSDGTVQTVFNPYSFADLKAKLSNLAWEQYVNCTQISNNCVSPNIDYFAQQGVLLMQIITKCRANVVNKQWDAGAFAAYANGQIPMDDIGQCLIYASNQVM